MTGVKSDSISEKTTERSVLRFFSPLIATMYAKDDWGNLEEYGEEVFPAELCSYETEILKRIAEENLEEEGDRGLYVSLWNSGDEFFLTTEEGLKGEEQEPVVQKGGIVFGAL